MKTTNAYGRLRAYTLWTVVLLSVLLAAVTMLPLLVRASLWTPAVTVFVVAFAIETVTSGLLSWQMASHRVEGSSVSKPLVVAHVTASLVALALDVLVVWRVLLDQNGFAPEFHAAVVAIIALVPLATAARSWGLLALTGITVAIAALAQYEMGLLSPTNFTAIGLTVLMAAGGLFASVRASIWYLESTYKELDSARIRADLAVAEERLRFSRDLHDIFGRTLTAVAVKSDLAAELSDHGQSERASAEMRQVHALADQALAEVRHVVAGYRAPDLHTELLGAKALLESSGTKVTITGDAGDNAPEVLGWVVREGVTNVLRHSSASRCEIKVSPSSVEVCNDGAPDREVKFGSGLSGIRDRVHEKGGALEVNSENGEFSVRVQIGGPK